MKGTHTLLRLPVAPIFHVLCGKSARDVHRTDHELIIVIGVLSRLSETDEPESQSQEGEESRTERLRTFNSM